MHARRVLAVLALVPLAAGAQVHKWVDSQGKTHYGDRPPEEAKAQALKIETPAGAVGLADQDVDVAETEMVWFRVGGLTLAELNASKEANGPFNDIVESKVWGQTGWRIRWKFQHDRSQGGCRIGTFKVTVTSKIWLPRWEEYNLATSDVRAKWDAFYKGLVIHENGHKANGIKAGNDLARRLRGMRGYQTCEALNTDISQIGNRIMSEYGLVDRAFDRVERIYREGLR